MNSKQTLNSGLPEYPNVNVSQVHSHMKIFFPFFFPFFLKKKGGFLCSLFSQLNGDPEKNKNKRLLYLFLVSIEYHVVLFCGLAKLAVWCVIYLAYLKKKKINETHPILAIYLLL